MMKNRMTDRYDGRRSGGVALPVRPKPSRLSPGADLLGALLVVGTAAGMWLAPRPAAGDTTFSEHLISSDYTYAYGLAAADIDRDGDLDVTSSDTGGAVGDNENLYWYENDGAGGFTRHFIREFEPGYFERHATLDFNGDGWPDVVVVKNLHGQIVWFENDHTPGDGEWARHVITSTLPYAYDVAVGDLDLDGDLDVAASSYKTNEFRWFENPGDPVQENWVGHLIATAVQTRTIRIADFNADGWPDLLGSASEEGLYWFENTGTPAAGWISHRIRRGTPVHGEPFDMDGDGDPDIVMAGFRFSTTSGGSVEWYENRDGGTRFRRHRIDRRYAFGFEAAGGDLDGDGDVDVVASAWNDGRLSWFENVRGDGRRWTEHELHANWINGNSVLIIDANGDGRLDIFSTAERGTNELRWWRNEGPPP